MYDVISQDKHKKTPILNDVKVRVVSKRTKRPLIEYQKTDLAVRPNDFSVERFIEAKTGEDFQVEVLLKENSSCQRAWGIPVSIEIDGGVVNYRRCLNKASIEAENRIVFDSVLLTLTETNAKMGESRVATNRIAGQGGESDPSQDIYTEYKEEIGKAPSLPPADVTYCKLAAAAAASPPAEGGSLNTGFVGVIAPALQGAPSSKREQSIGKEHANEVPELLGTTENELGIRKWLEDQGHTLVTTSDKEGENSTFDKELVDAEVIITTPFHPGYLTAERLAKAKNLKLAVTAGIGSDHVDLDAANKTNGGITVAEVTGSNVVSVAEHVIMTILVLVRNFVPAHDQIVKGDWDVAGVAKGEYDLENKVVGTVAVGRIGERVLRRLKPFDCKELLYFDYQPLKPEIEKEIGCRRVDKLEDMLAQCDIVTINCPLHEKTRGLFNKELISKMKKGSWLVNTARGAIVVKEDVAEALKSGHLRGYGGDVWFPQPAPKDHPLRYATNTQGGGNAMVAHMSGTSLDAQKRYADGTKSILQSYFSGKFDYKPEDLIVKDGDYATKAYGQRSNKS
ncbi:MAG: hypothetical protein L6R41_002607 [Letrouitia leprolyta]|nr:MAG: hypothetical protein L6R41_002607 [Letrouitia leprolyta]